MTAELVRPGLCRVVNSDTAIYLEYSCTLVGSFVGLAISFAVVVAGSPMAVTVMKRVGLLVR